MPRMTMIEAIRDAMDVMMARDERVVVFGEDVGYFGGVFRCTAGLQQKYGKTRCFDAPINESGIVGGQTHSQSPEALFTHVSGLKTVVPSNPYDAKGLLIAAIEDPDPVIFLEPKRLYHGPFDGHHDRPVTPWSKHDLGEVPEEHYSVPLGKAVVR